MKIKKLLQDLNALSLPSDQFAVTSSGCMAVRGLREANDLDLVISDMLLAKLSKQFKVEQKPNCIKIQLTPNIEAVGGFSDKPSAEEQIASADNIGGVRFVNLETVKMFKKRRGGDKDLVDIELIDKYLETDEL